MFIYIWDKFYSNSQYKFFKIEKKWVFEFGGSVSISRTQIKIFLQIGNELEIIRSESVLFSFFIFYIIKYTYSWFKQMRTPIFPYISNKLHSKTNSRYKFFKMEWKKKNFSGIKYSSIWLKTKRHCFYVFKTFVHRFPIQILQNGEEKNYSVWSINIFPFY